MKGQRPSIFLTGVFLSSMISITNASFARSIVPTQYARSFTQHANYVKRQEKRETQPREWTILIYIQACNNLESFAHKNLEAIANVGSNERVTILVELHKPGDKSWRYRIDKGNFVVEEVVARSTKTSPSNEVVDAMRWATSNYPAEKNALIFWNHGIGVIDPSWQIIEPYYMKQQGLWRGLDVENDGSTPSRLYKNALANDRGILFDEERRTFLTNTGLKQALHTISTELLNGKKIDVIGMDACLMGMIEIEYQIKNYAKHFVGSQEFEFAQGWSYGPLMEKVTANSAMDGKKFSQTVVETFNDFYSKKTNYFTQSSVDLSYIESLKDNLSNVARSLITCYEQDAPRTHHLVEQARRQCLAFSVSDYIDIYSFYDELSRLVEHALNYQSNSYTKHTPPHVDIKILQTLKNNLDIGKKLIVGIPSENIPSNLVTANATGRYLSRAKGISIYFPQKHIDESYLKTDFAQSGQWLEFLIKHLHSEKL